MSTLQTNVSTKFALQQHCRMEVSAASLHFKPTYLQSLHYSSIAGWRIDQHANTSNQHIYVAGCTAAALLPEAIPATVIGAQGCKTPHGATFEFQPANLDGAEVAGIKACIQ